MTAESLNPLQSAIRLFQQTQSRLAAYERAQSEPIAIIGMGCRFPHAENPAAFWRLLEGGAEAIREVPAERWNIDDYYDPDPSVPGKMSTRWGGFLDQVDQFDADFFGISPREAIHVDPQHRLLLEVSWEALEDAGLPAGKIARTRTGVYVGVIGSDFALLISRDTRGMDAFSGTGASHAVLANRLSYVLDLNGPSMTLDTACSSSLVTIHLACRSLRQRETDLALAGGVNLILSPEMTVALSKAHMMAPDGRCKTFDAAANGYVRGEGCGMVVLKRVDDAIRDGDRILAVIRGTAVNHDGRSNGLSAPNGPAQEAVIRAALADAGLTPEQISYIEAHGTGTRLGDPIEIEALREVLCKGRSIDRPLVLGSVKTNIGHLESAAGIAGLLKLVLMLRHGKIPPHLNLRTLNPLLKLEGAPIEIATTLRPWPDGIETRRAGVSSFGFGGTNAHVILEESPTEKAPVEGFRRPRHLLAISARTREALAVTARCYAAHLEDSPSASLADVAFTAGAGRAHFTHRAAVIAASIEEAKDRLKRFAADPDDSAGVHAGQSPHDASPRIAFLFTGQGAQYPGMAAGLYNTQPTFRAAIDRCAAILDRHLDRPLLELLSPEIGTALDQTGYTQPVMFAVEYALATLWQSWGIQPAAVMGHSVGEFAAACVAGVMSLEDGLTLIAQRARLMQSLPQGGLMAAVFACQCQVDAALESCADRVMIAALNGPESVVISGDEPAVREVLCALEKQGINSKILATSHAFHSHRMDPILDPLRRAAESVTAQPPKIPLFANLTGKAADARTYADPEYWCRHARSPVRFAESVQAIVEAGCEIFLEIGPSPTLIGMGRRCVPEDGRLWLPSLRPGRDDWQTLLDTMAQLYVRGAPIDWDAFDRDYSPRKTELPTYQFQRKQFPIRTIGEYSSQEGSASQRSGPALHPLLGRRLIAATSEPVFESQLAAHRPATLGDHRIQGTVVMPGAAYLEMALAASAVLHGKPWRVAGVSFREPLLLEKTPKTVQTIVTPEGPGAATFRIVSLAEIGADGEPSFATHATGKLEVPAASAEETLDIDSLRGAFTDPPRDAAWQTEALKMSGLEPGPSFTWADLHWANRSQTLGEIRAPRSEDRADDYWVHPGLLDTMLQLLGAALPGAGSGIDAYIPMGADRIQWHDRSSGPARCLASITSLEPNSATGDVCLVDAAGKVLVKLEGVRLRRIPRDWMARLVAGPLPNWSYELAWAPQPLASSENGRTAADSGRWLIFDSQDEIGAGLARRLETDGHHCVLVPAGANSQSRRAAVKTFMSAEGRRPRGVVDLASLDVKDTPETPDFQAARASGWGGALDLAQSLVESARAELPQLWLVTQGAQAAGNKPLPVSLGQSATWGLARVIAVEHPELACRRIDLDPETQESVSAQLLEELCGNSSEDQIAYRDGQRYVARLRRIERAESSSLKIPRGQPYRLEITTRGQLDHVALRPATRTRPGPGQIEIRVRATGLNFRDVLNVLDLYPGDPGPLGGECAGEVVAVGDGVTTVKPGDQILGLAPASFASYAVTLAEFVVAKPERLTFEEAATIPICFATAHYALRRLGQIGPGKRVLIHAASGGVGLAAIQIARRAGAEIFATAGSSRKRDYLKSLGIRHVMDSRSLEFAEQIREATGGEGVDLVLNSLTGETIAASLSVLRPSGHFLELGKTDLWDQARVDQSHPGVTFHAIALDQMMADQPDLVGQLMGEVLAEFNEGTLEPLPLRALPIDRVVEALRHMARAEHIGKVILQSVPESDGGHRGLSLATDGTYLVTGGLGGLGLKVARWLVDRGARHLVLMGRSGCSEEASRLVEDLQKTGARILIRKCDVGDREDVVAMLSAVRNEMPPMRGIFHLAGTLDDGVLREQTRERFDRVMASKVAGAWNLHELSRDEPLDLFVLFSSAAALLGSPGQANYAAANAFLDALAHHRRWQDRPALSVNWGSWAEVGMAARLRESEGKRWSAAGVGWIEPGQGLETMEHLLLDHQVQAGVLPIDWPKFLEQIPAGSEPAWLADMAHESRQAGPHEESGPPVLLQELTNVTPAERLDVAVTHLRQQAARVLAMDESQLPDPRRPLNELGFDSLTGVEFCNRVGRSIGKHLNPTLLFDYPTLDSFAGYVLRDVLHLDCQNGASAITPAEEATHAIEQQALAEVESMSEAEMDTLVNEQLEKLQK